MFTQRRLAALLSAVVLAVPMMAQAAPAADTAAVKELVQATNMQNMLPALAQRAFSASLPMLEKYLVDNKIKLTPAQQKKMQEGMKGYAETQGKLVKDYFDAASTKQQFEQALVKQYGEAFTTEEVKQVTAFVKSPAGQKWAQTNEQVMTKVAAETMKGAEKALSGKMEAAAANYAKSVVGK
ncbi:DUF2059 domain-containing protein [Crenobacter caeni]|uniref:DUF2059 domain-containing protein n=1 Tax=Crenobacter caeni TaxID=2705474 RepID=A0A6B2KVA8_9NEIS|nr:DUF2059 domain-containing protein [Crenobacter caeni]NDV14195.1 DUF2059 domain-containing protein [Crenobacter caeni]